MTAPAPVPTPVEQSVIDRFEAAPPAPESWDPNAALHRVLDLADAVQRGDVGRPTADVVAHLIRVAVFDSAAVTAQGEPFTCPRCGRTSWHPEDKRQGYCDSCHDYTAATGAR